MTNVAAILGSGTSVMALYGFHRLRVPAVGPEPRTVNRRNAVIVIAAMVLAIIVPLAATSATLAHNTSREAKALGAARSFGEAVGWKTGNATTLATVWSPSTWKGRLRCRGRTCSERS
jgi:hypothetical protein